MSHVRRKLGGGTVKWDRPSAAHYVWYEVLQTPHNVGTTRNDPTALGSATRWRF